ncbi:MAG TPA: malectin domain-containing carbohydrate-binding protein, partial [Chthoniobacteraceae bacterium]|nr:malectin domain-containing carbohydrate-binding protein [Chthoniobacteraceae bacterium]
MKLSPIGTTALALAFAVHNLLSAPPKNQVASPTLSDEATQAIKAAFPDATIGAAKLNIDRGLQVYYVGLTGDKNVDSVEVTALAPVMVLQSSLKVEQKDLPDAVAKAGEIAAAARAPDGPATTPQILEVVVAEKDGVKFFSAEKITIDADFTPKKEYSTKTQYKLAALDKPETAYELTYTNKEGVKGVIRLDPGGTVISPMNWMKHDAAVAPDGKLVIRLNFGCPVDYTDLSGTVWKADRVYTKENGFGALGGRPAMRLNLTVQGTDAPFLYDSERDKEGAARFDVPNGKYTVRIHFCETW